MAHADKGTEGQSDANKENGKEAEKSASKEGAVHVGINTTRRLKMDELTFEAVDGTDESTISLAIGDGKPRHLSDEEIDSIVRLMASQQRRRFRAQGASQTRPDGRGRVVNPETDHRTRTGRLNS